MSTNETFTPPLDADVLAFDGDHLECARIGDQPYVSLPSLCRPFGKDVQNQRTALGRWGRTVLGTVKDASGRVRTNITLLHAEDVPLFVARLNQRGMSPKLKAKHDRYLRFVAIVLASHFGLARQASTPAHLPAPLPSQATQVISPVATLGTVMVALSEWVKDGKLSKDLSDRYVVDYMQRNNVLDFTKPPPALPECFNIRARPAIQPTTQPVEPVKNGSTDGAIPKFGMRGPFYNGKQVLAELDKALGMQASHAVSVDDENAVERLAQGLQIFEHSFWGKFDKSEGCWLYDADALRKLISEVRQRIVNINSREVSPGA